jgi:hypothetical protein
MKLTLQQLEAHLWGAANILRGKTAGQDYKNYILSLMFYKRLCDQWECEADDAIAEQERQQGRAFSEKEKAVFRKRGEHRFQIPNGSRWGGVKAASTNLGELLTKAMRAVANANDELRGVFTVDWNQPAPDGSGKPLIANEVVHALVQHFDEHDLSNRSVPSDVLGRAYEYLIKQFADDAGAKAGEFFTPPEVVDTLVRILKPLFSFAGQGVHVDLSRETLERIPEAQRGSWLLQEKVEYAPALVGPDGTGVKAEIRMMFLRPEDSDDLVLAINLVRLSRGKMHGVDHNKGLEWVGSSVAIWPGTEET